METVIPWRERKEIDEVVFSLAVREARAASERYFEQKGPDHFGRLLADLRQSTRPYRNGVRWDDSEA